jgi:flagellar biosynthesis/type III secretory pathway protein FliH
MLAKVLKYEEGLEILPFSIPEIGEGARVTAGVTPFSVPEIGEGSTLSGITPFIVPTLEALPESAPVAIVRGNSPDDVLQNARDEAARIIAQAEENAVIIHQVAEDKAIHEANLKLETMVAERVSQMRDRLSDTIQRISNLSSEITAGSETGLVDLALQIAKKVVGREVATDREIALNIVKTSLAKLHDRSVAAVHLNPEDFAFVEEHRQKIGFRGGLELVEDATISMGGCLVHTETGEIDARIESQFDEIAHGLLEI